MNQNDLKEQINNLMLKADEDIKSVEILISEGFYRIAYTRIYYSMFYMVSALLLTKNIYRKRHKGVISAFNEFFIKTKIFDLNHLKHFSKAFEDRMFCDYSYGNQFSKNDLLESLNNAVEFNNSLKVYLENKLT